MNVTIRVRRQDPEAEDTDSFLAGLLAGNRRQRHRSGRAHQDSRGHGRHPEPPLLLPQFDLRFLRHADQRPSRSCLQDTGGNGALQEGDVIDVEPAGNMPVIKDLVVNFDLFWDKIMEVEPYLQPQGPEPEQEYVVSNESMLHLSSVTACIMCGACVSDCTVMEVDPSFLGPAALAKAYRFTADPRDGNEEGVSQGAVGAVEYAFRHLGLHSLP